jgi:hypothetical protein
MSSPFSTNINDRLGKTIRREYINRLNTCKTCYDNETLLLSMDLPIPAIKNISKYTCCNDCTRARNILNNADHEITLYYKYLMSYHKYTGYIERTLYNWCFSVYYSYWCMRKFDIYSENIEKIDNYAVLYTKYQIAVSDNIIKQQEAAIKRKEYQKAYYQKNKDWYIERRLICNNKLTISY